MKKTKPSTQTSRFKRHFNAQIDTRRADVILIICFFISGLTDAGAYNAWKVFLSMQVSYATFLPQYFWLGCMAVLQRGGKSGTFPELVFGCRGRDAFLTGVLQWEVGFVQDLDLLDEGLPVA